MHIYRYDKNEKPFFGNHIDRDQLNRLILFKNVFHCNMAFTERLIEKDARKIWEKLKGFFQSVFFIG